MISPEEKDKIVNAISNKLPSAECPMCHNKEFILADGYTIEYMQDVVSKHQIGGAYLPSIAIICSNCGCIQHFALGSLGVLLDKENKSN